MKKNIDLEEIFSQHYNKLVKEYEIDEYIDAEGHFEYTISHKETGKPYITLNYYPLDAYIEIRLLEIKGVFLVRTDEIHSLVDFIDLPADELMSFIHYIDIQGKPPFYYSAKLSNSEQTVMDIAADEHLQVKLIAALAEVKLALHFAGLLYQKNMTDEV